MPSVNRRLLLIALATLLLGCSPALTVPRPAYADERLDPQAVDRWISTYAAREGLPGASVTVVHDGAVAYRTPAGREQAGLIPADRPMAVGSVSKMITAFAVLQLVDAGRLDLDGTVSDQLPGFTLADDRVGSLTLRQLLSHRSGLPNPSLLAPAESPEERVAQLRDVHLVSDPGSRYLYSNLNYHVAARLVEVTSGQDFASYLRDHVFAPLGMDATRSVDVVDDQPGTDDGYVTAYGGAIALPELRSMTAGAGGVISTADDLARWLAMQQRGGVTEDGTRLLSEALLREAQTPVADSAYGFGWQRTRTSVPERVGHDGSLTRYSSRVELVPRSGYGFVVLLNSYTPITKHPFEISAGVVDLTEGRVPDAGLPIATLVDVGLAVVTAVVLGLGVLGARRSSAWAARRRAWPSWRFGLRLLPQLVLPALAVGVFVVLPTSAGPGVTAVDAFGLWPAVMVLLAAGAVVGLTLTGLRLGGRRRWGRLTTCTSSGSTSPGGSDSPPGSPSSTSRPDSCT